MKLTFSDGKAAVYDEVLPPDELQRVWQQVQTEQYKTPTKNDNWIKVWRLGDGPSVSSGEYLYSKRPFNNALDSLIQAVVAVAKEHRALIGAEGLDWKDITLRAYLYPRGSKLSWHDDTACYSGAFSYYVHPRWAASWGGELLLAETAAFEQIRAEATCGPYLDRDWENRYVLGEGRGAFISAKPNRLVLTKAGVYHSINRVDPDAGDNVRCSISGFFMTQPRS